MKNKKVTAKTAVCLLLSAALLSSAVPAASAEGIVFRSPELPLASPETEHEIIVQPLPQIVLSTDESGNFRSSLNTAIVNFMPVKAFIVDNNDNEIRVCLLDDSEDGGAVKVNAEILPEMAGGTYRLRIYFSETKYIETDSFTAAAAGFDNAPQCVYISPSHPSYTFYLNVPPETAELVLYKDGTNTVTDVECKVDRSSNSVTISPTRSEGDLGFYYLHVTDQEGKVYTHSFTMYYPCFIDKPYNTILAHGDDSVNIRAAVNSIYCTKTELYSDGEKVGEDLVKNSIWAVRYRIDKKYLGHDLKLRVYYEDYGEFKESGYFDSDVFRITEANSERHFTVQPNDIPAGGSTEWELDFEPLQQELFLEEDAGTGYLYLGKDKRSLTKDDYLNPPYIPNSRKFRIRAYYGPFEEDYIDSAVFTITLPEFTVQPKGGYITEGGTLEASWDYTMQPKSQQLVRYYKNTSEPAYEDLDPSARSVVLGDEPGVNYYVISAVFDMGKEFKCISDTFYVIPTGKEVHKITAPETVRLFNTNLFQNSNEATEGDHISVICNDPDFLKWDTEGSNVQFTPDTENSPNTSFSMPDNDVELKYIKKQSEPEVKLGDVNNDGKINSADITKTAAHIKGLKTLKDDEKDRADVNKDGKINSGDITKIAAHIKGLKKLS